MVREIWLVSITANFVKTVNYQKKRRKKREIINRISCERTVEYKNAYGNCYYATDNPHNKKIL